MGAQQTEILQQQRLHSLELFFLVPLQIFWDSRPGLCGTQPEHMHYHATNAPRNKCHDLKQTSGRRRVSLHPILLKLKEKAWGFWFISGNLSAVLPVLLGTHLLPLFSQNQSRFTSPSISIRFHFIWIMAEGGNRSGQRLFSYQTLKKSITQKERHLQITVQSIPHKC